MITNKRPTRAYYHRDADMMRLTQLHKDLFVDFLSDFHDFNPNYNESFAEAWQSAINAAWEALGIRFRIPRQTSELIKQLNAVWEYSQEIVAAAKLIYKRRNPARYRMFRLS